MSYLITLILVILVSSLRQVNEYERGVMLVMGRFSKVKDPGWRLVIPVFQRMIKVDLRVRVIDVPDQEAITKDNISMRVNAVVYYNIVDAESATLKIQNYEYAISQLAQTTMRDVVGETELDQLLSNREEVSARIRQIVDKESDAWGIKVRTVELKHVELPEEMKRTIAKQAEAEREKRAVIIKAQGEVIAAENMAKAADLLSGSEGALHLRTLQSINDLSSDQSNTVILALPIEVLRAVEGIGNKYKKKDQPANHSSE